MKQAFRRLGRYIAGFFLNNKLSVNINGNEGFVESP